EEISMESPQFLKNAGVALLHPFLSSFFRKLKLVDVVEFKNFKSQSKAVLLIHFLATGEEKPKEYETLLPKLLCGMPVNLPLDHTLKLTKKEKKEADQLLQAAIDHWGALGNTSPDGLREGFLMRDGKLENGPTGWKLYVEQKAQDILLDKLPWNLSMIKLPWMKEILWVEWR
uniref:contractile injection system tape measure protein n=1 Tax=Pricia sp. TaxID=2268138 RepID=UPI0035938511